MGVIWVLFPVGFYFFVYIMTQDSDALYLNMPYGYQSEQILGKKTHPLTKEEKKELRKATKERRKLKW
jgi:shikimate kinase